MLLTIILSVALGYTLVAFAAQVAFTHRLPPTNTDEFWANVVLAALWPAVALAAVWCYVAELPKT